MYLLLNGRELLGFDNPTGLTPGFVVPLYWDHSDLWVQDSSKDGIITRFVKCEQVPSNLIAVPFRDPSSVISDSRGVVLGHLGRAGSGNDPGAYGVCISA